MIDDISSLQKVNEIRRSDSAIFIRSNEYSTLLSYGSIADNLTDVFQDISIILEFKNEISALLSSLDEALSSMLTREEANHIYASKDEYDLKKEQILTQTAMDSLMKKYVTEDIANAKAAELRAEATKMADEMTDFAGAAMVGINQSTAGLQEMPSEGETKKKKDY